jgi:Ser/Thr protein kinase RdoA (MazF antagonist)
VIREAEQALRHYSLIHPEIAFIRHNENMTFKITDKSDNSSYLLRIHRSVSGGLSGIQHTPEGLQSEMDFLAAIGERGGLRVQKPVRNREGELVTAYVSVDGDPAFATLLEWLDGSTLTLEEDDVDQIIYKLGEYVAQLHDLSRTLQPVAMKRPVYDAARIDETLVELHEGVRHGALRQEDYDVIETVLFVVKEQLMELDARGDAWGYIHADFQHGNVIVSEGNPTLIDFCLFGYGYYLFDLGSASSMLSGELRRRFLEGYASCTDFSFDDLRYIEGQILMDIFISYVFFIHDSEKNGWIKDHAAMMASTRCRDFLEGREVFYIL